MPQDLATFLQQLFNGLSIGSIYVLVALGITLIFGLTRLLNFAHGQFLVLGSFIAFTAVDANIPYWAAVILAALAVGTAGVLLDRLVFRPTLAVPLNGFIVSLGLIIALSAIYVEIWTPDTFQIDSPVTGVWDWGGVRITHGRALLLVVTAALIVALFVILRRTDAGRSMRAVAENPEAAAIVGVNVSRSISTAFFLGSAMAAIGGALLGILFPFTAFSGTGFVIKGVAVALIGGLGSIEGAVVIGLVLGVAETFGVAYGVDIGVYKFGPEWRDGYAFLLMIAVLIWRPHGLFGAAGIRTEA